MSSSLIHQCLTVHDNAGLAISDSGYRLNRAQWRNEVMNRAVLLRDMGLRSGQRVVICLPKSPASVSVLMACLAIGAVAVPVDIRTPLIRLQAIIAECDPSVFAAPDSMVGAVELLDSCQSLAVDGLLDRDTTPEPVPIFVPEDSNLALILMSSGSTGTPKGIRISHGNLLCFVQWAADTFDLSHEDRFISIAPLHFDLSLFDILASQFVGASVHLLTEAELNFPAKIASIARQERVTILYTVPTILQMMVRMNRIGMPDLRWVLFAGEVMPTTILPNVVQVAANARLANLYGPTETNVVTWFEVSRERCRDTDIPLPIGKPCTHSRVWAADTLGKPVAPGCVGEICVQGPTVSSGYWGRPDLTEHTRISEAPDTFRTGDLGWQDDDGVFHYSGRRDSRVKIRGNLVDLAEIEVVAMQSGLCHAVAVILKSPDTLRASIECHVVPNQAKTLSADELISFLKDRLPVSCIPSSVILRKDLPQTSTGKIDRQSLMQAQ